MVLFANLGPVDLSVVFIVALLIFGPKKLPEVGKQVGTVLRELRKLSNEFVGVMTGVKDDAHGVGHSVRGMFADPDPAGYKNSAATPAAPLDQRGPATFTPEPRRRGLSLSALPPDATEAEDKTK